MTEHALGVKTLSLDRIGGPLRNMRVQTEAEHIRCPEYFRACRNVPGRTPMLAGMFRGNVSASGYVLPEHFRARTNLL